MPSLVLSGVAVAGTAFAGIAGFSTWIAFDRWNRRRRHRESIRDNSAKNAKGSASSYSPDEVAIAIMKEESRKVALGKSRQLCPTFLKKSRSFEASAEKAGLSGEVTVEGFCEARAKMCFGLAIITGTFGALFSLGFCIVLAMVGALIGWRIPSQAIAHRAEWRTHEMERHLPEMLDVIALGMRSGLSFDSSLKLYESHFDTFLSKDMLIAQRKWTSGLERREEALRVVASSFDSPIFTRVVETIVRSLRFGSSMAANLDAESAEARLAYRAKREEQIAKAPVKMMVPTGTLILPAMLILVMGPVLLELINGGF